MSRTESRRRIRLDVAYVGTAYEGWQRQPGRTTVQSTIERALEKVLHAEVSLHGSGRTDAGVHARGQVAHFDTDSALDARRLREGANHHLPWDIRVLAAVDAPAGFDARRSAVSKEYRYRIVRGDVMPPHMHPFALLCKVPLDMEAMVSAAERLIGRHDFAAFRSMGSSATTTVRTVYRAAWTGSAGNLVFRIEADGFLYKMVRRIVGSLLEVGHGARTVADFRELMGAARPRRAAPAVDPRGLHLWRVRYGSKHGP
jgi:tRNA pseudouridine38-40 synthase